MAESIVQLNLYEIPVSALGSSTTETLSVLLNPPKVLLTDEKLERDWRGLANLVKMPGERIPLLVAAHDPTSQIIKYWKEGTLGLLQQYLGQMDRWDIVDDTLESFNDDAHAYLKREEKKTSAPPYNKNADQIIITIDDLKLIENGLSPQHYDAFLLYADEDYAFAKEIVEKLEGVYKLKLCIKDRDLISSGFEHSLVMNLIQERCNFLLLVMSEDFLKSEANKFFVSFATACGIDLQRRKIIYIYYRECMLPPELRYYHGLNYYRLLNNWGSFWEKLYGAVKQVPQNQSFSTQNGKTTLSVPQDQSLSLRRCSDVVPLEEINDSSHLKSKSMTDICLPPTFSKKPLLVQQQKTEVKKKRSLRNWTDSLKTIKIELPKKWFTSPFKKSNNEETHKKFKKKEKQRIKLTS